MHNAPVFCSLQATMATRPGTGFQRDRSVLEDWPLGLVSLVRGPMLAEHAKWRVEMVCKSHHSTHLNLCELRPNHRSWFFGKSNLTDGVVLKVLAAPCLAACHAHPILDFLPRLEGGYGGGSQTRRLHWGFVTVSSHADLDPSGIIVWRIHEIDYNIFIFLKTIVSIDLYLLFLYISFHKYENFWISLSWKPWWGRRRLRAVCGHHPSPAGWHYTVGPSCTYTVWASMFVWFACARRRAGMQMCGVAPRTWRWWSRESGRGWTRRRSKSGPPHPPLSCNYIHANVSWYVWNPLVWLKVYN